MAALCKTEGCGGLVPMREMGKRGAPRVYCVVCRPPKGETTENKPVANAYIKQATFDKKSKRDHQRLQYTDDLNRAGVIKLYDDKSVAILGDEQNGRGDQIQLLVEVGVIASPAQIISFCDELTEEERKKARKKNAKNRKRYPEAEFIDGNMINHVNMINKLCGIVDYDACSSLLPTARATKELPVLFSKLTVPVFQVNVLVHGWGVNDYRSTYDDLKVFNQMLGFDNWEFVWSRNYESLSDDGKGLVWTYRTYTFRRVR